MLHALHLQFFLTVCFFVQDVDIIVFPEDGIYGMGFTREALEPYLEYIPDPKSESWNPCTEPEQYANSEVQQFLSCLARNNSLYVVANFGDNQPCDIETDSDCPDDGHYQYNTNIVYDNNGTLIARYHKQNLFFEYQFDTPKSVEFIYFDTPFGRFGTFICFDIMFEEPAVSLLTKYNVTNVVFPTAWMDAPPLLAAIQFHSAFAAGFNVNFLAANIHRPKYRFHGSGIYSPEGALVYYYNDKSDAGKLLISDLFVLEKDNKNIEAVPVSFQNGHGHSFIRNQATKDHREGAYTVDQFQSKVFEDRFTFSPINTNDSSLDVCQASFCCHLEYEFAEENNSDYFAFGAFDGLHTHEGTYYLQICAFLTCDSEFKSCENTSEKSLTKFKRINIKGTFETDYVFPEILLSINDSLALAKPEEWTYQNDTLFFHSDAHAVMSVALFGRVYERDSFDEIQFRGSATYLWSNCKFTILVLFLMVHL